MDERRMEIVEELDRLMAEEAEAFLRYFQLRYRLRGTDRLAAESFFDQAMQETLEHAEEIAGKIRKFARDLPHDSPHILRFRLRGAPPSEPFESSCCLLIFRERENEEPILVRNPPSVGSVIAHGGLAGLALEWLQKGRR